jgi:ATP-dependent helicase/nuclease subunit A
MSGRASGDTAQGSASDPAVSAFVAANAGSGKTSTLVRRVARLLLRGARPETILCVTYTKAAAAEMQRRLFLELGDWAVTEDAALAKKLAELGEPARNLGIARALFARALETPGGIKITTIHAFCEKLLKRFPLEAGVTPGFTVLDEVAAREVSAYAREQVALEAMTDPDGSIGRAYSYFSVELDHQRFQDMFAAFEAERRAIGAYAAACEPRGYGTDVWARCGFDRVTPAAEIEAEAVARIRWGQWRRAAEALTAGGNRNRKTGAAMLRLSAESAFAEIWDLFSKADGEPLAQLAAKSVDPWAREWLQREQARLGEARTLAKAARIAEASVHAVSLALAHIRIYDGAKAMLRALDFGDLIQRAHELLTIRADAAWVLFKLDGGVDHVLLDEAQDTAPDQWDIIRALTAEFFIGQGAGERHRTVFAVGDEKQSIFSFQGAAPERLAIETEGFAALVSGAERPFRRVRMTESWRSTEQILQFVDKVFEPADAAAGLKPAGATAYPIVHKATRQARGTVDLWPVEETTPPDESDPWAPVDQPPPDSANKKLARRIAESVRAMVARGEMVGDGDARRAMGYGDVLILVRRRNALFHEIIRALKRAEAPVGGADRLLLSEHIAFEDLLALGRFARFPLDDLTVAALLRSPFCDVCETGLFDLAHGRRQPLWSVLQARAAERPAWGEAARFLAWARAAAEARPPFDFFGRALAQLDERGVSMKRRFLVRLGPEGEDALDAFLAEALAAERRGVTELERFIAEMAASEIEVKREQDEFEGRGAGQVRVMTAHGAKGLEAPVVILPDTTTRATALGGPLLPAEGGGFLWAPRKADDCPASARARQERERAADHESLRLLYVALTRARDRLIVCGVKSQPHLFQGSWRDRVEAAFAGLGDEVREAPLDGGGFCRRFGVDPAAAASGPALEAVAPALPAWTARLAPAEPAGARFAAPSRLAEAAEAAQTPSASPLARTLGLGRYRRGDIIHRLLQQLPDVAPAERAAAAARLLGRERDLTDAQRAEMREAAFAVLDDPRFAAVFGPGSRPEIALAGSSPRLPPGLSVSGRVDRLLVEDARVLVADFKTNRPAPAVIEAADPAYVRQMAAYWAVLREIFPGRAVEAALIWTDGPKLMPIPENLLERALAEMRAPA